jgi:hypothetical protein
MDERGRTHQPLAPTRPGLRGVEDASAVLSMRRCDFEAMNAAYVDRMGDHRLARTVIGVRELPKPGVFLTTNLTAVTAD